MTLERYFFTVNYCLKEDPFYELNFIFYLTTFTEFKGKILIFKS